MKLLLLLFFIMAAAVAQSQELQELDLIAICQGKSNQESNPADPLKTTMKVASLKDKNIVIIDKGFCNQYL